ncbi:hypothetical protein RvY_18719 [Ramazzottius varieornatus]|uniref:BTB domain-containing protein n=1 Tax=Ramazzottius varieornatus TaxID=947166 RepID=A0A1D1W6T3_RAMVA|nr:hypothetical protein RvY_18719 [Ramazzottius varieornatus]
MAFQYKVDLIDGFARTGTPVLSSLKTHSTFKSAKITVFQERSEYFTDVWTRSGAEVQVGLCRLPDLGGRSVDALLLFIYSGLKEVPRGLIEPLLSVPDNHGFSLQKDRCEILLVANLTIIDLSRYQKPSVRCAKADGGVSVRGSRKRFLHILAILYQIMKSYRKFLEQQLTFRSKSVECGTQILKEASSRKETNNTEKCSLPINFSQSLPSTLELQFTSFFFPSDLRSLN